MLVAFPQSVTPPSASVIRRVPLTGKARAVGLKRTQTRRAVAIPNTNVSLLVRLKDTGDSAAWQSFVEAYAPLLYGFGLRRGIARSEIDDFVQDVMSRLAGAMENFEYDPSKGTFRSWMFQTAKFVLLNRHRYATRRPDLSGGSSLMRVAEHSQSDGAAAKMEEEWEWEYRRQLFARAAVRVREEVGEEAWESFRRTAIEGESGEKVAADLGIAVGTLYVRRSRMLKRVREEVRKIEKEWGEME